ncbi:MAG: hypothetical protein AAB394_03575 [Patescibacteria group bacterium]
MEAEKKGEETTTSNYREGVSVRTSQKTTREGSPHTHFVGLHEAIVSEQTRKSLKRMMELPILKKEKEHMRSEKTMETIRRISEKSKIPVDEFYWLNEEESALGLGYYEQRQVLNYVCEEIQQELSEKYKTKDAVFSVFLGAQLTGRLLPVARLVEQVFGEGSFRILGNMTLEKENTALILDTLKKMRSKNKNG